MFTINGITFKEGDIVEKHDGAWKYWTTIQNLSDATLYQQLVMNDAWKYRVVRGPEKDINIMMFITEEEVQKRREAYRQYVTEEVAWLKATMKEITEAFKKFAPDHVEVVSNDHVRLEDFCDVTQERNGILVSGSIQQDQFFNKNTEQSLKMRIIFELGRVQY